MAQTTQLNKDLLGAQQRYAESVRTASPEELDEIRGQIKQLRSAIADAISEGAAPCPDCGGKVHGMMKREGTDNAPPQYEVGCLNCKDHRARGWSEQQAVERWNQGVHSSARDGWVPPAQPVEQVEEPTTES